MKLKVCLSIVLFFAISSAAEAYIYSIEKSPSGKIVKPSSKQTSSIVRRSVSDDDIADYNIVISELQNKINENPQDYSLFPPLIEAYLKTNKFSNAYEDLLFLNSIKNSGRLSDIVIQDIDSLRLKTIERSKYSRFGSPVFVNIALLNLICDNYTDAENYIRKAAFQTTNPEMFLEALKVVIDTTKNYEGGISFTNIYIKNNQLTPENKNNLNKLRVYFYTNLGRYDYALQEQISYIDGKVLDDITIYETYKLLVKNNSSDDKVLKVLFGEESKNKDRCYYRLYNILVDNNAYEDAKIYSSKLEKQYPASIYTAFYKSEKLLLEGQINQVVEILNSISDKLTNDEDIIIYNRLMASISRTPDKEALKLFNQGYPDKALELLEGKNIPQTPNILAFKARCCMELGRMQEALDFLNRAISLDSENLFVNLQFGNYYYANKEYETARKYAQKCLQIDSENTYAIMLTDKLNEVDAQQYVSQIISTYEAQNYKETERLIEQALKISPKSAILYYYQGLTNIAENNYAASTASLYKALELDSSNPYTYYYLGIAFDNLSEYENACSYYIQFLKKLPPEELGESEKIEYAKARINKLQNLL